MGPALSTYASVGPSAPSRAIRTMISAQKAAFERAMAADLRAAARRYPADAG